jgi:hypothetical protein
MRMPNLHRRVEALEKAAPQPPLLARETIAKRALHRLSVEDLRSLRVLAVERRQGTPHRERTAVELTAVAAYHDAVRLELELARPSAAVELKRTYHGT